jgi:hypothetical protein
MGKLYETVKRIERVIGDKRLDVFMTKGQIAIKAGFSLGLVREDTPDDPGKQSKLEAAARTVLGAPV